MIITGLHLWYCIHPSPCVCNNNAFWPETQVLRPSNRWCLLMFPMCYFVKVFPFRDDIDKIYSNTTGTGNIGFWMPVFAGSEYNNSQLCYWCDLHFWVLDHHASLWDIDSIMINLSLCTLSVCNLKNYQVFCIYVSFYRVVLLYRQVNASIPCLNI